MKSRGVIDQIKKLKDGGHSIKKIAVILSVSRNTVRRHLRSSQSSVILKGQIEITKKDPEWKILIDWIGVCEKRQKGYTAQQIYQEYQPNISYSRFCTHLKEALGKKLELAIRLHHNPGEKVQVDFCDGIPVTDHRTGKQTVTFSLG